MPDAPPFDLDAAHKHFASSCFNACWGLIDKEDRTAEEDEEMLRLAVTSHYHWTCRSNYGAKEASVANWQISRVYALLGDGPLARRFGQRSLDVLEGTDVGPFFAGYAQEALARAAAVLGDDDAMAVHLAAGRGLAAQVENADHRSWLEGDLASVGG